MQLSENSVEVSDQLNLPKNLFGVTRVGLKIKPSQYQAINYEH